MRLDPQEIHTLCIGVGWTGDDAIVATVMALASSGGDPDIQTPVSEDDDVTYRGLFGLSVRRTDEENKFGYFDYRRNARRAYAGWKRQGGSWVGHPLWPLPGLGGLVEDVRRSLDLVGS